MTSPFFAHVNSVWISRGRYLRLGYAGLALFLLWASACRDTPKLLQSEKSAVYEHAALATPHPICSEVGKDILAKGGNAIDAAVAVQFAMAVVYPRAGNLGGGGFMVYRSDAGEVNTLDFREKAPAAAGRDMYLDEDGEVIPDLSLYGHRAVGVPGTVAGIVDMHDKYGQLPWKVLVQPAIDLARNGFPITQSEIDRQLRYRDKIAGLNEATPFLDNYAAGDLFIQPQLAETLERIGDQGKDGFYTGLTAQLIEREMQSGGGLITQADLKNYQAVWREPINCSYRDYEVYAMPPPSSGGIALCQMLGMIEPYPLTELGFQSIGTGHITIEAMRRAYEDRAKYLGDSDFYPVPIDSLLDSTYIADRMQDFDVFEATVSETSENALAKESFETTHISIVDSMGNAVAITTTLNGNYGSKVIVDGAGFFLNNEMDDFSAKPGVPNMFGLVGAEANAIAPGKRMLSSMTPTIITKDNELFLVLGAPGGSTIITAVLQVFTNVVDYGMPLDSAINAPRFHHQWLPDSVLVEAGAFEATGRDQLEDLGHGLKPVGIMAVIKAIHKLPNGQLHATGDQRNPDDDVSGF